MEHKSLDRNPAWAWVWFVAFVVVGIALVFIPAFIIRPFRYESPRALQWAMALRQAAPLWTLLATVLAMFMAFLLRPAAKRWGRAGLVAGLLLAAGSATLSRLNHFEWMFHPVRQPGFEAASQAKLDPGEMVLALNFNHDARAYPIRVMGYHHIVNDVVGGVAVAVTY